MAYPASAPTLRMSARGGHPAFLRDSSSPSRKRPLATPLRPVVVGPQFPTVAYVAPCLCLGQECRCLAGMWFGGQHVRRGVVIGAARSFASPSSTIAQVLEAT